MSEPEAPAKTDSAAHLVALVTNQDQVVHNWVQLLVTIQAGLAVAVGFILKPGEKAAAAAIAIPWFAIVAIPILGIASAVALAAVIVHEQKWQVWFAQQFNKLPGLPRVFPADDIPSESVDRIPFTFIARVITGFAVLMCILWIGLLCVLSQDPKSPFNSKPTSPPLAMPTVAAPASITPKP